MKIRSITGFCSQHEACGPTGAFLAAAREAFTDAGFEVQTVRLALPPLRHLVDPSSPAAALVERAVAFEERAHEFGIDYVALGPHRPGDPRSWGEGLLDVLRETQRVFVTLALDDDTGSLHPDQAALAARVIADAAPLEPNGFANLRFSTLASVPAGVPFLPAAYAHADRELEFALATESASLPRACFADAPSIATGIDRLVAAIEDNARRLESVAHDLEARGGGAFTGVDFSFAPFPDDANSVGATLESMGLRAVGEAGTTVASSILTSALDRAEFTRTGFSGLFLPVLEDDRLAARAAEGTLRTEDLLLASTVCGTGLDTVPLPGDVDQDSLIAWLLDLGAIALRHGKPLTARLMPMPGRKAGDALDFDFPFFASGKVMELRAGRVDGLLRGGPIPITPRRPR